MTKFDLTRGSCAIFFTFIVFALFAQHREKFPLQLFGLEHLHQHFFFLIHISEQRFSQIMTILCQIVTVTGPGTPLAERFGR